MVTHHGYLLANLLADLSYALIGFSHVGSQGLIWLVIAALAALVWKRPAIFLYVTLADLVADITAYALREAIGRDRPPLHFAEPHPLVSVPHSGSFPSGHTATSFACAATLAWLTPLPKTALFLLATLIAFSRVYNGVHYPLDVVVGACVGLAIGRLVTGGRTWYSWGSVPVHQTVPR